MGPASGRSSQRVGPHQVNYKFCGGDDAFKCLPVLVMQSCAFQHTRTFGTKRRGRKNEADAVFKEVMADNFPRLMRESKSRILEA